jgi:AcrR family transcriptional regulator
LSSEKDVELPLAIDRRVTRTRTLLYDALIALVRRKPYEQITIDDILRQADIGRSTFYAHFTSKDDLLQRSLERLKALLISALGETLESRAPHAALGRAPSRVLFEHVAHFKDVQLALAGGRGGTLVREAVDAVLSGLLSRIIPNEMPDAFPRRLVIRQVVGTFHTVLAWWLEEQPALSASEVDDYFRSMLLLGLPKGACDAFLGSIRSK